MHGDRRVFQRAAAGGLSLEGRGVGVTGGFLSHRCNELAHEGCEIWRVGDGQPIAGARTVTAADLPAILAETTPFETPDLATATLAQRDRRRAVVRAALRAAAAASAPGCPGEAVQTLDPENRWFPYAPLSGEARASAVAVTLAALDAQSSRLTPHANVKNNTPSQRASQP